MLPSLLYFVFLLYLWSSLPSLPTGLAQLPASSQAPLSTPTLSAATLPSERWKKLNFHLDKSWTNSPSIRLCPQSLPLSWANRCIKFKTLFHRPIAPDHLKTSLKKVFTKDLINTSSSLQGQVEQDPVPSSLARIIWPGGQGPWLRGRWHSPAWRCELICFSQNLNWISCIYVQLPWALSPFLHTSAPKQSICETDLGHSFKTTNLSNKIKEGSCTIWQGIIWWSSATSSLHSSQKYLWFCQPWFRGFQFSVAVSLE